jgi:hypothetical protein
MTGRPVNIQATRDWVMYFRGELLDQPYLTLIEKEHELDPLASITRPEGEVQS